VCSSDLASKVGNEDRKAYASNLYAYPDEAETLKKIAECGIETVYQTTPEEVAVPLQKVLGI